jgi:hypothetical protein
MLEDMEDRLTMSELPEVYAKYIFLDVVNFTSKTAEARMEALNLLNETVTETVEKKEQVPKDHVIYLPTGDGICIALINIQSISQAQTPTPLIKSPYDIHLRVALNIIKIITEHNDASGDGKPRLEVRIGINEDMDYEVRDINGNRNIAGVGINDAQRIMSLAGGNQIFVGEEAYRALRDHDDYHAPYLFHTHRVIVKHDTPMNVYQFVAKEKYPGLNTDVQELERRQESVTLIKAATACGLKKIYPSRGPEVMADIQNEIRKAQMRVWVLGVGLTEKVQFNELLPVLKPRLDQLDVKILFLNALRSPALFRTFLEIDPTIFREIIKQKPREYFQQKLYNAFHNTFTSLKNHPEFNPSVRFYGSTPICWMVIIDETAYFQPYTFGGEAQGENRVIGPWLPVFKFAQPHGALPTDTFKILEQHFDRLWRTSNADLFHMGVRVENRDKILNQILKDRADWFKYVYNALYGRAAHYGQRKYPRRHCGSEAEHTLIWQEDGKPKQVKPEIVNFSREGLRLALKDSAPAKGTIVTVKIEKIPNDDHKPSVEYIRRELIMPCGGVFKVIWHKRIGELINVGLFAEQRPHAESPLGSPDSRDS